MSSCEGKLFHHLKKWKLIFSVAVSERGRKVAGTRDSWRPSGVVLGGWGLNGLLFSAVSHDTVTEERGRSCPDTERQRVKAAVAKNKPRNEKMTISNHKVKLRVRWAAGKETRLCKCVVFHRWAVKPAEHVEKYSITSYYKSNQESTFYSSQRAHIHKYLKIVHHLRKTSVETQPEQNTGSIFQLILTLLSLPSRMCLM